MILAFAPSDSPKSWIKIAYSERNTLEKKPIVTVESVNRGIQRQFSENIFSEDDLRAIFWENRESQDTRQKIEFFIILPKHPF